MKNAGRGILGVIVVAVIFVFVPFVFVYRWWKKGEL